MATRKHFISVAVTMIAAVSMAVAGCSSAGSGSTTPTSGAQSPAANSSTTDSTSVAGAGQSAAAGTASGKPIVIGASLSLSGDFSADGEAFKRGYELWASDVNNSGGLLGRPVKLDIVSDASSPAQVVTNYEKLISSDKVDLVFGPFSTFLTLPSSRVANRFGYAFVEGAGGAPSVFQQGLKNVFDVSLPIEDELVPVAQWAISLPPGERPATVALPTSNDPFTQPQIQVVTKLFQGAGIKVVYSKVFPAEVTDFTPIADQVAQSGAQMVVLGSVDVPTVSAFTHAFAQQHYNPKIFAASAGPDQGAAFVKAVGASNTAGIMYPNGWYGSAQIPSSQKMVQEYISKYGGHASDVNADVAEAYSVGQVIAQAVTATNSVDNAKIIAYLRSGVTMDSVQGPVKFDDLGQNHSAVPYIFQWQNGTTVQVLPASAKGSVTPLFPKPAWSGQ